jgi:hypothetical protein
LRNKSSRKRGRRWTLLKSPKAAAEIGWSFDIDTASAEIRID